MPSPDSIFAPYNPEAAIGIAKPRTALPAVENDQLLPKAEMLGKQSRFGLEDAGKRIDKLPNHRKRLQLILIN